MLATLSRVMSKRCKDAGTPRAGCTRATEDAAAHRSGRARARCVSPAGPLQDALRRRDAVALEHYRGAQRAADSLERGLGAMMVVASGRLDVDRDACGLSDAAQDVDGEA